MYQSIIKHSANLWILIAALMLLGCGSDEEEGGGSGNPATQSLQQFNALFVNVGADQSKILIDNQGTGNQLMLTGNGGQSINYQLQGAVQQSGSVTVSNSSVSLSNLGSGTWSANGPTGVNNGGFNNGGFNNGGFNNSPVQNFANGSTCDRWQLDGYQLGFIRTGFNWNYSSSYGSGHNPFGYGGYQNNHQSTSPIPWVMFGCQRGCFVLLWGQSNAKQYCGQIMGTSPYGNTSSGYIPGQVGMQNGFNNGGFNNGGFNNGFNNGINNGFNNNGFNNGTNNGFNNNGVNKPCLNLNVNSAQLGYNPGTTVSFCRQ